MLCVNMKTHLLFARRIYFLNMSIAVLPMDREIV